MIETVNTTDMSIKQLDIADEVVRSEPWDDGTGMSEPINPEELMDKGTIVPNGLPLSLSLYISIYMYICIYIYI